MEWRNRLYQFEAQPPEHIWDNISEELGLDAPISLREGLYQLDEAPPEGAWDRIAGTLEPAREGKVRRMPGWSKVAVAIAASIIAFLPFMIRKDNVAPKVSVSMIRPPITQPSPDPLPEIRPSDGSIADVPVLPSRPLDNQAPDPLPSAKHIGKARERIIEKDHNYIYFTSRSGDQRRISYKLEKMLPAIRSDLRNDTVAQWMSALENSRFIPSGNNFFDILELVKLVDQKQR